LEAESADLMRVLAGDIGGTNVRLQVAEVVDGGIRAVTAARFESAHYATFDLLLREFLAMPEAVAAGSLDAVCLAVAGPIRHTSSGQQAVKVTNLPWELDSAALARDFGFPRLRLINDFQAVGYGIEALTSDDLAVLQQGEPEPRGMRAVLGAGTGLGQAILVWQGEHCEAIPTEGGHVDFAPTDEEQVELWRYLKARYGRVSCERIVSGPGLVDIYTFLKERGGVPESPRLAGEIRQSDPAMAISHAALTFGDPLASRALDLFVRVYGAQAGNFALSVLARGGVYIAGGIAPKIIDKLRDGNFIHAFRAKGRMSPLLERMPVSVVMNEDVGLLGAVLAAVG
jgi:glucokinase